MLAKGGYPLPPYPEVECNIVHMAGLGLDRRVIAAGKKSRFKVVLK